MMNETPHINSAFDDDLADINNQIAQLGALAESQLSQSLQALVRGDASGLDAIIARDAELDQIDADLNEKALSVIAMRAPMAEDLRRIIVALKIAAILERTGDYAKNIAKRTKLVLAESGGIEKTQMLQNMSSMVQEMLNHVLDAYMETNVEAAMDVWARDIEVDKLHFIIFKEVLESMKETPDQVQAGSHMLFIAKNIERVGDHATGIAEQIYFLVNGRMPEDKRPKDDRTSTNS